MKKTMRPMTPERADMAARAGMESAAVNAEKDDPGWGEKALEKLRGFAEKQSADFTMEVARLHIQDSLPRPKDLRSWGPLTATAINRRIIKPVFRSAPAMSSHNSLKPLYAFGGGQ